jgi:general secretion pathway protein A
MYKTYFGMTCNPFRKDIPVRQLFQGEDLKAFLARMEYLKQTKGVAVLFGRPGMGKTTALRAFTAELNSQLFSIVYQQLTTTTVTEFYRGLCHLFGLEPPSKKVDLFRLIQNHIQALGTQKKQTPVLIFDEAQFLSQAVLNELRMLFSFHMDSKDYAIVILCGQNHFISQLNLHGNEPLRQRIQVHYEFTGLTDVEVPLYVQSLLKHAGVEDPVFKPEAMNALTNLCGGSPRILNHLVERALILAFQHKTREIDAQLIQQAHQATAIFASVGGASA